MNRSGELVITGQTPDGNNTYSLREATWGWLVISKEVFPELKNHKYWGMPEECVIMRCYDDDGIWYFTVWATDAWNAEEIYYYLQERFGVTRSDVAEFQPFIG